MFCSRNRNQTAEVYIKRDVAKCVGECTACQNENGESSVRRPMSEMNQIETTHTLSVNVSGLRVAHSSGL